MQPCTSKTLLLSLLWISFTGLEVLSGQPVQYSVEDSAIAQVGDDFYGIQYHSNTYSSPILQEKLSEIPIKKVRIWARPNQIRPNLEEWDWSGLDNKVNEVIDAGYEPIVCIFQAEDWYTGTPENPWWNDTSAVNQWLKLSEELAGRYADEIEYIILFDELNYLHQDNPYYISFSNAADLYIQTASTIKAVDPDLKVGGPSGFNGWENGHWGNYVFNQTEHDTLLDFISSNIFLSWDKDDSDQTIINKTIWYEEAPMKIRSMLNSTHSPTLMLDAYNASALWTIDGTKDGELWTDPRNVNTFGGVYQALAQLHSAKGGFDITLKWETIGGYGIFNWYPDFNELPTYYSWELMAKRGALKPGSELIKITTTENPIQDLPHHSGMNVDGYRVQPFAIRDSENNITVILINKTDSLQEANINPPADMNSFQLYQFHESRTQNALAAVDSGSVDDKLLLELPPLSINIISYSKSSLLTSTETEESGSEPDHFTLFQNYPNPFNPTTSIAFRLAEASFVQLSVYNARGQKVKGFYGNRLPAGEHSLLFDGSGLSSGIYFYRLTVDGQTEVRKFALIK
ncbi:T9SS type A sorting domain-containing protein [Gracilimonas sp.]|uniref:T9SS type A sorting domain-containing protein n=1 Tax=Gracilimonas sp. TaxID=1974203 RepID=UPI003D0A2099